MSCRVRFCSSKCSWGVCFLYVAIGSKIWKNPTPRLGRKNPTLIQCRPIFSSECCLFLFSVFFEWQSRQIRVCVCVCVMPSRKYVDARKYFCWHFSWGGVCLFWGRGEMRLRFCLVKKKKQITNLRNKRLNLSRSQDKAYSHAYNTPFLIKSSTKDLPLPTVEIVVHRVKRTTCL